MNHLKACNSHCNETLGNGWEQPTGKEELETSTPTIKGQRGDKNDYGLKTQAVPLKNLIIMRG